MCNLKSVTQFNAHQLAVAHTSVLATICNLLCGVCAIANDSGIIFFVYSSIKNGPGEGIQQRGMF